MPDINIDELKERVLQFECLELPGQPKAMHMGTFYLVGDLWRAIKQFSETDKLSDEERTRFNQLNGSEFAEEMLGLMRRLLEEFPNNDRLLNPHVGVVTAAVQSIALNCKLLAAEAEQRVRANAAEAKLAELEGALRKFPHFEVEGEISPSEVEHVANEYISMVME